MDLKEHQFILKFLINHIFLPINLPHAEDHDFEFKKVQYSADSCFLKLAIFVINLMTKNPIYEPFLEHLLEIARILENWDEIQSKKVIIPEIIHENLKNIEPGQSSAFYIARQNSCLLITMLEKCSEFSAIISTFSPSIKNEEVMRSSNDLINYFPIKSFYTKEKALLKSKTFADQLATLFNYDLAKSKSITTKKGVKNVEMRDVNNAYYIDEWIIPALVADSHESEEPKKIKKKIRDEIQWKNADRPFRRAPMYLALKSVMHILLNWRLKGAGVFIYKIIICNIMKTLCDYAQEVNDETKLQMIQRLAKKVFKIEKNQSESFNFQVIFEDCQSECLKSITELRNILNKETEKISEISRNKIAEVKLSAIHLEDISHKDLSCYPEINRLISLDQKSENLSGNKPISANRYIFSKTLPPISEIMGQKSLDKLISLRDIEEWIQVYLNSYAKSKLGQPDLGQELLNYFKKVFSIQSQNYKNDPLGHSRMVLSLTHILCTIDRIATKECELLKEYEFGVKTDFFQYLLLPKSSDLEYANSLKEYIDGRNSKAKYRSIISHNCLDHKTSFYARFFDNCQVMKLRKATVMQNANKKAREKELEYRKLLGKYESLLREIENMDCDYYEQEFYNTEYFITQTREIHSKYCGKCKKKEESNNIFIEAYEFILPSCNECLFDRLNLFSEFDKSDCVCQTLTKAVIFELEIPYYISNFRDTLHLYLEYLFTKSVTSTDKLYNTWINYSEISSKSFHIQKCVTFGSKTKSFAQSHYRSIKVDSYLELEEIFKPNGYSVDLSTHDGIISYVYDYNNLRNICHFNVPSPYKSLSFAVEWVDHTENKVISRQSECPTEILLSEFKKFGFFRAGGNLQMLNLLDAVETRGLPFQQEAVYTLLSQSLWQVGPLSPENTIRVNEIWYPNCHEECASETFMFQMLKSLRSYLEISSNNWSDHFILLNIVTIAGRLMSMSPSQELVQSYAHFMRECRKVALSWKEKIENILLRGEVAEQGQLIKLKEKLLHICMFGILSFYIDKKYVGLLINSYEDCICWLDLMSRIYDIGVLFKSANISTGSLVDHLQKLINHCILVVEDDFKALVDQSRGKIFTDFSLNKWGGASEGMFRDWKIYENSYYYRSDFLRSLNESRILVQIGLDGVFLIQGQPIGKLPKEISIHPLFKCFFEKTDFEVQPGSGGVGTFTTSKLIVSERTRVSYTFFKLGNDLVILEHRRIKKKKGKNSMSFRNKNSVSQLLPSSLLSGHFPVTLVKEFSHWVDRKTKKIEFRAKTFANPNYHNDVLYILDLNTRLVLDTLRSQQLINIKSETFKEITEKITFRIELPQFVHIFVNQNCIVIELIRYNLSFKIVNHSLESHEFRGMIVSPNQQIQTLFGIEEGLVLIDKEINPNVPLKKKIIIPHSTLHRSIVGLHRSVKLDLNDFKNPVFFTYDIDEKLRILRAGESNVAWLYLAWLHASTSLIVEDPFLQQTGTSRALQLLQSANCWSCKPLSGEAYSILTEISQLSPTRNYYPMNLNTMQSVEWPRALPCLCAHEAYRYLCKMIIEDSQKVAFLYKNEENFEELPVPSLITNNKLACRAYFRHKRVNHSIETVYERLFWGNRDPLTSIYKYEKNVTPTMLNVSQVMAHNNDPKIRISINDFHGTIAGPSKQKIVGNSFLMWEKQMEYLNTNWIDLYNLAKSENIEENINFSMMLSFFAFRNVPTESLLLLKFISMHKKQFAEISPPPYDKYDLTILYYSSSKIIDLLNCYFIDQKKYETFYFVCTQEFCQLDDLKLNKSEQKELITKYEKFRNTSYNSSRTGNSKNLEKIIKNEWPNKQCNAVLDLEKLKKDPHEALNSFFFTWYKNLELTKFFDEISAKIEELVTGSYDHTMPISYIELSEIHIPKDFALKIDLEASLKSMGDETQILLSQCAKVYSNGDLKDQLLTPLQKRNIKNIEDTIDEEPNPLLSQDIPEFPITFSAPKTVLISLLKESSESWKIFSSKFSNASIEDPIPSLFPVLLQVQANLRLFLSRISQTLDLVFAGVTLLEKILARSGLWPSTSPNNIFSVLINKNIPELIVSKSLLALIGGLGVYWVSYSRIIRCITYYINGDSMRSALQREINCRPHENWSPSKRPEWLILEIEMDIMIRPIQIRVANDMMEPPKYSNSVMQLNMGEGKTAVIIPMILATLPYQSMLVRLVVLKSLFNINFSALSLKMGGILNQRIYSFPCRRDLTFDLENVKILESVYQECLENRGVILTLPEHMLSFQLKGLEKLKEEDNSLGVKLVKLQNWIEDNTRDVLDESDEILGIKYQLVYSIGKQNAVSGGKLRWEVSQAILLIAKNYFGEMKEMFGIDAVESYPNEKFPMAFPHFRFLNKDAYKTLCEKICTDIIKNRSKDITFVQLKEQEQRYVKEYILEYEVSEGCREAIKNIFVGYSESFTIAQILRGIFTYEVFLTALSKRWRVDFGVNFKSKRLLQAVPYRAKDVPAERAQYEHPDIAILLTQLSYFYGGLSESQLDDVFANLSSEKSGPQEYERWVQEIPSSYTVHPSIKEFSGLNLSDVVQKSVYLYPTMKMHPLVINYWLNHFVYPKEGKQFDSKLSKSAWDICRKNKNPLTGFSGTNDTKVLLPLNVKYYEIEALKHTNGSLISRLLLPENNVYINLQNDSSGCEILKEIACDVNTKLLLDVGALMLDLDNQSVVLKWLDLRNDLEAGVFFKGNDLVVINRKGQVTEFEMSTYRRHLEVCVIYLDDCHTRGTDLKIPKGTIGAVTLGRGVTKDKLMQACMRMRMLGDGHSVKFFSSREVHNQISKLAIQNSIGSLEVIKWAFQNTATQIEDGFMYWASQGLAFYKKEAYREKFLKISNFKKFSEKSTEFESLELDNLYNANRTKENIIETVSKKIIIISRLLQQDDILMKSYARFEILNHLVNFAVDVERFAQLHDEEHEVELEIELEHEREIEKPKKIDPVEPMLHNSVKNLLKYEYFDKNKEAFMHFPQALKNCSIFNEIQVSAWSKNIFATFDFYRTVSTSIAFGDDFLKSPRWVAYYNDGVSRYMIIMSAFEVNSLKSYFNIGKVSLIMIMPRTRADQENLFQLINVPIDSSLISQVLVFAGNQYFRSEEEMQGFFNFVGICPDPRSEFEQECFERNLIEKNGYVLRNNRYEVFQHTYKQYGISSFENNPSSFIIKLAYIRFHGAISKFAHYFTILQRGVKPEINYY